MPVELELKLRIPNDSTAMRVLDDDMVKGYMSGGVRPIQMTSFYYDTPADDLSSLRWSLRLRKEGDASVGCMKTSSVDVTPLMILRNEWEVPAENIFDAVPLLVAEGAPEKLAEIVERAGLVERCRMDFVRRCCVLKMPNDVMVELCIDKGIINADGKTAPVYELELELMFGPPEELVPLCDLFTEKYQLERESLSKYERALRLIRSR